MRCIAIDPGNTESAYIILDSQLGIYEFGKIGNLEFRNMMESLDVEHIAIEVPRPRGRTFWQVISTTLWVGRFLQIADHIPFTEVDRRDVKNHFKKGKEKMNDSKIRAALIEMWGGKEKAIGCKKDPGPLFGVKADIWQALAVGVTYLQDGCKAAALHTTSN